jgi:glycogen debranching enzyme
MSIETLLPPQTSTDVLVPSRLARAALVDLVTPHGIQASNWELFQGAVFGRDSEAVAQDIDGIYPEIFQQVVASLVRYQGVKTDVRSGEEPGRIFHELRFSDVGGPRQQAIFRELSEKNGIGRGDIYLDYGTVDASPQLIRTVAEHVRRHGSEILEQTVPHQEGEVTVGEAVRLTAEWVSGRIDRSDMGLLERLPSSGIAGGSQTLRDGATSYLHENGQLADMHQPIASVEVQGLAYDALLLAAKLTGTEEEKEKWRDQANALRLQTFKHFWMPDRNNWAMAVDRDEKGRPRQLKTTTTLPAELLETGIFENLPEGYDQQEMISPLVRTVFSPDILTAVGPRMRSLKHGGLLPYADYQGSWTVWPVSTNIIAKGLHRYGFHSLERDLSLRTLAGTVGVAGSFPEFMYVNADGEIGWPLIKDGEPDMATGTILATNFPELNQAWTVSAVLRMTEESCHRPDRKDWRGDLSEEIRRDLLVRPSVVRLHPYRLDRKGAAELEKKVV